MSNLFPITAIVGRRNVGKSTLFNSIINEKKAIVDSIPGLTRDIISKNISHDGYTFTIADTPGLDLPESSELSNSIVSNAMAYLSNSSLIILLLENPSPHSFDYELADIARKTGVQVIVAVNKVDDASQLENANNFYELGFKDVIPISALSRFNLPLLLSKAIDYLPKKNSRVTDPDLNLVIVGRPNSGKSTLLNAFLGFERSIVSDIPGTTRDAVDDEIAFQGKRIKLIDTAGMRKKSKIDGDIEFFSMTRTVEAIKRSDVVVHMIDSLHGITDTDKKIADEIINARKPTIIALNKWDAVEKDHKTFELYRKKLIDNFYRAADFQIISISALNKQRIHRLLTSAIELKELAAAKIETRLINKVLEEIIKSRRKPQNANQIKIYYATQTKKQPPTIRLFVNKPDLFRSDIIRFFEKSIRDKLGLHGIPIVLEIEGKKGRNNQHF
jgi:GTP-binding protein